MRISTLSIFLSVSLGCAASHETTQPTPTAPPEAAAAPATVQEPRGNAPLVGSAAELTSWCEEQVHFGKVEIEKLKAMPKPRALVPALAHYDDAIRAVSDADGTAQIALNSEPDPRLREAGKGCQQKSELALTEFSLDRGAYDAIAALDLAGSDAETQFYVKRVLRDFRLAGVDKDEATRAKVRYLNEKLTTIGLAFDTNIREDVRSIEVAPKDLAGVPADYLATHKPGANGKIKVTTETPDMRPVMTYVKNPKVREQLYRANANRGDPKNRSVLDSLLATRYQLATLLGYPDWASFYTADKMIQTSEKAGDFIQKIVDAAEPRMRADYAVLLKRKQKDFPKAKTLEVWDVSYFTDRVKAEQVGFDSQAMRPYLEYRAVEAGVFQTFGKIFGVTFTKRTDVRVWQPDVEAFDVSEGTTRIGRFYFDMHPRPDKYQHAAAYPLVTGQAGVRYPEAVLMCNFPKPGATPALMQSQDVETFFHEFGHLLHDLLGGHTRWAGVSGFHTEQDFVEAPSQLLEEWTRNPGVLQTFAKHYQTGEPIPAELVAKKLAADEVGKGLYVRQQMNYADISLTLHRGNPEGRDTAALVKSLALKDLPFTWAEGTAPHLAFGHLNGYSAAYYTYMWSLVIAKDLFTRFQHEGLLNPATAKEYRQRVLQPGGSKSAGELVHDFLGRETTFDAYSRWLNRKAGAPADDGATPTTK